MKLDSHLPSDPLSSRSHPLKLKIVRSIGFMVRSIAVSLVILLLSYGLALGNSLGSGPSPSKHASEANDVKLVSDQSTQDEAKKETLTMSISLKEGGVIDLKPPPRDVMIETWKGDDVIVIVEKVKRHGMKGRHRVAAKPVHIEIQQTGKDVCIGTWGGSDWDECGMDLSFRIMLPQAYDIEHGAYQESYRISRKLTSALWRVLHREAIRWFLP